MKLTLTEQEAMDFCCDDVDSSIQEIVITQFGQTLVLTRRGHWNLRIIYSPDYYVNDSFGTLTEMIDRVKILLS